MDRRGRVPGRSSGRRVTHPRRASSWVAPSPTKLLSALSRLWRKGATGREGAQKSWTRPVALSSSALLSAAVPPVGHFLAGKKATSPLRSRAVGPSDDELTDDGDVCPQVSGPAHADPLSRVRDHPRRATRLALPTEPFSPFAQCRPLSLTSSSFGAPNRMASSLGLRAVAPARARVATQSSRSMVVRAAVSTPAPVVVKREGTPGAGPAINP